MMPSRTVSSSVLVRGLRALGTGSHLRIACTLLVAAVVFFAAGALSGAAQFIVAFVFLWSLLVVSGVALLPATFFVGILLLPFEVGWGQRITIADVVMPSEIQRFSIWLLVSYADVVFLLLLVLGKRVVSILPIDWYLLGFTVWAAIGSWTSPHQPATAVGLFMLAKGMLPYLVVRAIVTSPTRLRYATYCLIALLLFEGIFSLYQFRLGGPTGRFFERAQPALPAEIFRASGTFYDPNTFALFLLMLLPAALFGVVVKQRVLSHLVAVGSAMVGSFAIIVSGSRVGWVLLSFLIASFWYTQQKQVAAFTKTLLPRPRGFFLGGGIAALFLFIFLPRVIIPRLRDVPHVLSEGGTISSRVALIRESLAITQRHLFLGSGLYSFVAEMVKQPVTDVVPGFVAEVHNIYLLVLAETGVIGLLLFLLHIRYVIRLWLSSHEHTLYQKIFFSGMVMYLVFGMMIPSFIRGSQFPAYMLLLGLFVQARRRP